MFLRREQGVALALQAAHHHSSFEARNEDGGYGVRIRVSLDLPARYSILDDLGKPVTPTA